MTNQRTLDMLYHSIYGDPDFEQYDISEDELSHHGVLGMSWGKRHGPPYPLDGVDKRVARAEAKRKRENQKKMEKVRKAAAKKRKDEKKLAAKQEAIDKKKYKLLKEGDPQKIAKNAKLFTNEELEYAAERARNIANAKESPNKKKASSQQDLENLMLKMRKIGDIAASSNKVLDAVGKSIDVVLKMKDVKMKEVEHENKKNADVRLAFKQAFDMAKSISPDAAANMYEEFYGYPLK